MAIHKLYYGGDERQVGFNHSRRTGSEAANVRYAGHLPTKHWVLPFEYDAGTDEWRNYAEMHDAFATGDVIHTHLMGADTRVETLVIHNKKATGIKDDVTGRVTTPAKVKFGLYAGETMVAETDEMDLSVIGRTVLEFGASADKRASTDKDTNDDGKLTKADTPPATVVTDRGAYLNEKATIRMTVIDGSGMAAACFSAFVEITDFFDARGCSCDNPGCPADEYPEPVC